MTRTDPDNDRRRDASRSRTVRPDTTRTDRTATGQAGPGQTPDIAVAS